ncbi:tRNA pseudouridine synthase B [Capnocytophaga canimorsus]|uniref:tRNA pseudouridine synthase B n=1 Tax=Capnocytophaga canimorsus TaxID=28188 RepID=A0A0B7HRM5_9FLAO|nr:tRNA pseudouridine(55) synthase TruB [Capnocytophaga canimorsus]CEN40193.1 tRNA pseudouridine synthase B [Capnocytophaga canimorsus]
MTEHFLTPEQLLEGQILLIDKPLHWSSFQAVNKIKWSIIKNYKLKKIKIGHAGTLDPLASGLLVICTGKFTKKITEFQDALKNLHREPSDWGQPLRHSIWKQKLSKTFPIAHITPELIEQVRQQFIGEIEQTPPVFSAIKREGKRLYELAREGEETIEVPKRIVQIQQFNIDISQFPDIDFEVVCSKGTYIRSLANDLGKALQSGAHLIALRRTRIGDFLVENALSPDEFIQKYIPKRETNEKNKKVLQSD